MRPKRRRLMVDDVGSNALVPTLKLETHFYTMRCKSVMGLVMRTLGEKKFSRSLVVPPRLLPGIWFNTCVYIDVGGWVG